MMNNDFETEDSVEMGLGKNFGFKELVLGHLKKILTLTCVEWRGGYFSEHRDPKTGIVREIYYPDTREIFASALTSLIVMLKPKFDTKTESQYQMFLENYETIKQHFMKSSSVSESIILGSGFYDVDSDKLKLEEYKQRKLQLHMDFFMVLSELCDHLNYFSMGGLTFGDDE